MIGEEHELRSDGVEQLHPTVEATVPGRRGSIQHREPDRRPAGDRGGEGSVAREPRRPDGQHRGGEAADFVNNLRTSANAIAQLWDDGETTPSQEDMENVHDAAIEDLLDAADECVDNAG